MDFVHAYVRDIPSRYHVPGRPGPMRPVCWVSLLTLLFPIPLPHAAGPRVFCWELAAEGEIRHDERPPRRAGPGSGGALGDPSLPDAVCTCGRQQERGGHIVHL